MGNRTEITVGGGIEFMIRKSLGCPTGRSSAPPLDGACTVGVRVRGLNGRLLGILRVDGGSLARYQRLVNLGSLSAACGRMSCTTLGLVRPVVR